MLVQERLQSAREQLPTGIEPFMTPVASLMGEILLVGVRSTVAHEDPDYMSPAEVRTLADWTIRRRLQSIPGIAEILNMGGGVRQIEVQPDPYLLQAHDVSLAELESAIAQAATTTTGGFIETGPTEVMVRNLAMTTNLADIATTAVKQVGDRAVTLGDVAEVVWGIEPMRGDASVSRAPEKRPTYGVIMSITKTPGFDTRDLTAQVKAALAELQPALPPGIETIPLFQQQAFIDRAIGNLAEAIRDGAIMVVVVLFLFLLNFRTTFITLTAMPMSFAITLLVFRWFDITVNSMTLGGLAVAIGMVVDDAIVDVENVFRRLRENAGRPQPRPRLQVIAEAAGEVRNSILYATLLVILVFLPLLGLKALLRRTCLRAALDAPLPMILLILAGMAGAFSLYPRMGKDFLPSFREETALIAVTSAPGTSLAEMNHISDAIESQILAVPEVSQVGRRLGRAERGDHVVPVSTAEFDIDFGDPVDGSPARDREAVLADLNARLKTVPGTFSVIGGPLADRIGHMLSGVAAPVAIKVFGPDLDTLRQIGTQVQRVAQSIPGFESAKLDQQAFIPQLRIEADRARATAYGLTPGALNEQVGALVGGKVIAELREGQRTLNLVLRLPPAWRESAERIEVLPVETTSGQRVPLGSVANVREARGPNVIFRENSQRRFTIAIKPTTRDVSTLVERLQSDAREQISLPEGYFITYAKTPASAL